MYHEEVEMTRAGRVLNRLLCAREEAACKGQISHPLVLQKQVRLIKKIIRRNFLFTKSQEDLVDLLHFCGNAEFHAHKILGRVLLYVISRLAKKYPCSSVRFELCSVIMHSHESVNHFLSTYNSDKLTFDKLRITEIVMVWITQYVFRQYDISLTHQRLLTVVKFDSLRELLRRMAWSSLGATGGERDKYLFCRSNLLVDLIYLCLVALYCQIVSKDDAQMLDGGNQTIVDCLKVLLRVAPVLPTSVIYSRGSTLHPLWNTRKILDRVFRWLRKDRRFDPPLFGGVSTLKRLAKNRIRSCLYSNWALPEGLHKLSLPTTIFDYLNLTTD